MEEDFELIVCISKTSPDCVKLLTDENFIKLHTDVFKERLKIVDVESSEELLNTTKKNRLKRVPILVSRSEDLLFFQESHNIMNYLKDFAAHIARAKLKKSAESLGVHPVPLTPVKHKLLSMKPNAIDMDTVSHYHIAIVNNKRLIGDAFFKQLEKTTTVIEIEDSNLEKACQVFKDEGDVPYVVIGSSPFHRTIAAIHSHAIGHVPISDIQCSQKVKEILLKFQSQELKD